MLEQLWEFIRDVGLEVIPLARVAPWERGVMMRFSKPHRELGPGWHWRIPFWIENCECVIVVTTTSSLPPQSLTTKDGESVCVEAIVRYKVADASKFLLTVYDRNDAVNDISMGMVAAMIRSRTWEQCCTEDIENEIEKKVRAELKKWGVDVEEVTLPTLAKMRSVRLLGILPPSERI